MNFTIQVYHSYNESLKKIWEEFEKESLNYCFQNYYWLQHWFENTNKKNKIEIFILLVFQNNKLTMILPFYIQKEKGIRLLKWQGDEQADYMSGLFLKNYQVHESNFLTLWKLIKKKIPTFDLVFFEKQPESIHNIENPFIRYLKVQKNATSNSLELNDSLDIFLKKNLKKKFIDDTRRRSKNLNKEGSVEFKIYKNDNVLEKRKITQEMIDQKIVRVNYLKLKNFLNRDTQNFYLDFDNTKFSYGEQHISSLMLDGKVLSIHWGVIYKKVFYHLMPSISYNKFMKYAPGRLLLFHLIKWSIDNKISKFDFTIGDETYKKDWAKENNFLYDYVECINLKAYPFYLYLKIKLMLKVFFKKYLFIKNIYKLVVRTAR